VVKYINRMNNNNILYSFLNLMSLLVYLVYNRILFKNDKNILEFDILKDTSSIT
jgi:hypothetical protein